MPRTPTFSVHSAQHTLILPQRPFPIKPTKITRPHTMQPMQAIFTSRMEPIQSHAEYPKYARSETKPVVRARHIIDQQIIRDRPCSNCVELKQDCYRWEGTFSKCAYCTAKDKNKEQCHLPGQVASPGPERRKRRKITGNIYAPVDADAASTADTMTGTFVSATTPVPLRTLLPGPPPTTGMPPPRVAAPPPPPEATLDAALDRVTALETQVSSLEARYQDVLVQLDEARSGNGSSRSTPAAAGASSTSAIVGDVEMMDEGEGKGARTEHTVEHADGYKPVNCSCTGGMGP